MPHKTDQQHGERIRVRGLVQGVGFRPTVWRLARDCGLVGEVLNDTGGVLIRAWGRQDSVDHFVRCLEIQAPPLSRIDSIERSPLAETPPADVSFSIIRSRRDGHTRTGVLPDAATCPDCLEEILDRNDRRYFYPFTNCTHCGPRLSIIKAVPYDRAATSMSEFEMCDSCRSEYADPGDRRFHAQPDACAQCGPRIWLEDSNGNLIEASDPRRVIIKTRDLIREGAIVAIKGIGGIHLACDAGHTAAVEELRARKHRYQKAFALMARDIAMIREYCEIDAVEESQLKSRQAPIVILKARKTDLLSAQIAPGQNNLGFMLPYTPLHHLLMQLLERPIVLTSGNRSDEPQSISNRDARERLNGIAGYFLMHDREILNRVDDSVIRVMADRPRLLRRARGFAPAPLALPAGFEQAPALIAMGGELKNTFCLVSHGEAIMSQHMGDLENTVCYQDYLRNISLYRKLFEHDPELIVVDKHPDYLSSKFGRELAMAANLRLEEVQHHHAHAASCMAETGLPLDSGPVLGIIMDGLGYGDDGTIWGGEFLQVDYFDSIRLAHFAPVPMPGGNRAIYEPWRNTFAHLHSALDWQMIVDEFGDLELMQYLLAKPLADLETMVNRNINSPPASSCGRLFDAVAAALGISRASVSYEGQAAMELQALAETTAIDEQDRGYDSFILTGGMHGMVLGWRPLWYSLLQDLAVGRQRSLIARRFHTGLAHIIAATADRLCEQQNLSTVVLSGGVFQNRLLLEELVRLLSLKHIAVLVPEKLPANDGGLAYGQAIVAAARTMHSSRAKNRCVRINNQ